jgi:DNA-binding CsgD family transcriptional regulator
VLIFALASQLRARQRLWTGPIADAVADARAADEIWREGLQMYRHASSYCLAIGLLEQGEDEEAARVLALGEHEQDPSGFFAAWRHFALGRLAAYRGDHAVALDAFLTVGRRLAELLAVNPTVFPWRSEAALAAQRLGDHERARGLIAEETMLAERFGGPRAIGVALRAAGLLERGETAVERLRSAVEPLAACGARVEQARAQIDLGAAIRRAGRQAEARGTLREALELADAISARALAARAREELRLAGGRAPAAADTRGGLTPSERRVAQLAGDGQSNRQIADALFLTVKSVEWHLGNVYRKLDIRGRGQLAAALGPADELP